MEVVQRGASAKDTICWVGSSAAAAKEKNNPKVVVVTYVSKGTAWKMTGHLSTSNTIESFLCRRVVGPSCPTSNNLQAGSVQILISHGNCSVASISYIDTDTLRSQHTREGDRT